MVKNFRFLAKIQWSMLYKMGPIFVSCDIKLIYKRTNGWSRLHSNRWRSQLPMSTRWSPVQLEEANSNWMCIPRWGQSGISPLIVKVIISRGRYTQTERHALYVRPSKESPRSWFQPKPTAHQIGFLNTKVLSCLKLNIIQRIQTVFYQIRTTFEVHTYA